MKECVEVAGSVGEPSSGRHRAACPACAETARALLTVRATRGEPPDLWPRLRAQLAGREDVLRLDLPLAAVGWRAAAVAAALAAVGSLAAEPGRLLLVVLEML